MEEKQTTTVVVEQQKTTTISETGEVVREIIQATSVSQDKLTEEIEEDCLDGECHPMTYTFSFLIMGIVIAYCLRELIPPGYNFLDAISNGIGVPQ
jgi:hypothetical protein